MDKVGKYLRSLGPLGTAAANILAFISANWVAVVSIVGGLVAALWAGAVAFFQRPDVQVGVGIFLALLWTLIGVLFLVDRRKPRAVRTDPDYRYGLTFDGIAPLYNPKQLDEAVFSLAIGVRNFSPHPIRYEFDSFELHIETRSLLKKRNAIWIFTKGRRQNLNAGWL